MGTLFLAEVGLVVNAIGSNLLKCRGPEGSFPTRSFGPGRSWRMATGRRSLRLASLIALMSRECSSGVPCAKFSRKTSVPERISLVIITLEFDAGPTVQTILVAI